MELQPHTFLSRTTYANTDHLHVTDPGTHWIRRWVRPQTGLDAVKGRNIFGPVENRTLIRISSRSEPSHGNNWREVLTHLCPQKSVTCRRNVGLLYSEREAKHLPRAIDWAKLQNVQTRSEFGPAELHFIHYCWR
jgi:hypothetical protein